MQKSYFAFITLLLVVAVIPNTSFAAQSAVRRDQQALTILNQVVSQSRATGGLSVSDATAKGSITYAWSEDAQTKGAVTLRVRGLDGVRLDAQLGSGESRSWSVRAQSGNAKIGDVVTPIPQQNAGFLQAVVAPVITVAAALTDQTTEVVFAGSTQKAGRTVYLVRVKRDLWKKTQVPTDSRYVVQTLEIDATSYTVAAVEGAVQCSECSTPFFPLRYEYSNYQLIAGRLVPLRIAEVFASTPTWAITIDSIMFNTGLTDADFIL